MEKLEKKSIEIQNCMHDSVTHDFDRASDYNDNGSTPLQRQQDEQPEAVNSVENAIEHDATGYPSWSTDTNNICASSSPKIESFKKLEYIYEHFQDSKKIYESDPDAVRHKTDNTLYPHINNDIEYGLFEDVVNSYYLDSQIKDGFNCNQECYTDIQQTQQEQQLTPCTHAYDHITEHINNLDDCTQQNKLYTMEEDASIFTSDTATPCD